MFSKNPLNIIFDLEKKLSSEHDKHNFNTALILELLLDFGFDYCFYFDAGYDILTKDKAIILTDYKYREESNEIKNIIGQKVHFKNSALHIKRGELQAHLDNIAIVKSNEKVGDSSFALAEILGINEKNRVHIGVYTDKNELLAAITCSWNNKNNDLTKEHQEALSLIGPTVERHIKKSNKIITRKAIKNIRKAFFQPSKNYSNNKKIEKALESIKIAIDGRCIALFNYDWYAGKLVKEWENYDSNLHLKKINESYKIGKYLTGRAWNKSELSYIIHFKEYQEVHKVDIDKESLKFHEELLGQLTSVLYRKLSCNHRKMMIRVFNRETDNNIPFTSSQELILKELSKELSFILDELLVEERLRNLQNLSYKALTNIFKPYSVYSDAERFLNTELIERMCFLDFNNHNQHLSFYYCSENIKSTYTNRPRVINSEPIIKLALENKNRPHSIHRIEELQTDWGQNLKKTGINTIMIFPVDSVYTMSLFAIFCKNPFTTTKSQEQIPKSHISIISAYLALVSSNIEAHESNIETKAAMRLVSTMGHEIKGPSTIVSEFSRYSVNQTIKSYEEVVKNLGIWNKNQIRHKLEIDRINSSGHLKELEKKSNDITYVMNMVDYLAKNPDSKAKLEMNFQSMNLLHVIEDAVKEVEAVVVFISENEEIHIPYKFKYIGGYTNFKPMVGDALYLRKAIVNILTNAIKYSIPPGRQKPIEVQIIANPQSHWNIVKIKNFGVSIRKSEYESIFKPFVRGKNRDERNTRRGLGLGLYMARKIISGHKGLVFVKDSDDKFNDPEKKDIGFETEFEIRIPINLKKGKTEING